MYTQIKCDELLREFSANADARFESLNKSLNIHEAMSAGDAAEVNKRISTIRDLMISVIPFGLSVPKAFMYVSSMSSSGDEITMVTITVSNKTSSDKSFRFSSSLIGDKIEEKAFNFLKSVYVTLIEDEMAQENADMVNSVLAQAVKEADLGYSIRIVTPMGNNGKKIIHLSDDEVVFVADMTRLMNIDKMVIFQTEPSVFVTEEKIQETYNSLCNALAQAQTTVQLVAMRGGNLIALLCDLSKRVKPMTFISKVYNKNIMSLKGSKDGIGFYNKDDIFAVVSREDGILELVLKPISTKTLEPVDFDVIGAVQSA